MYQLTDTLSDFETCGSYKYVSYKNVYNFQHCNFDSYHIYTNPSIIGEPSAYYLILVTSFSESFFHCISECAIYVLLYIDLKKRFPLLKIIFKTKFPYHKQLLDLFGISENDVVYSIHNYDNVCFFPLPISALNQKSISNDYILYVENFINHITNSVDVDSKTTDVLILPRQKEYNSPSQSGSRIHDCSDIITRIPTAKILHTDKMSSIKEQIELVKSSKTIILSDGSAFLFNGLLAINSTIIVLGDMVISQAKDYEKMNFYMEFIKKNNRVIFIPYVHGDFNNSSFYFEDLPKNIYDEDSQNCRSKYSIIVPTRGSGDAYKLFSTCGLKLYEKYLNKTDIFEFIITCPKENYTNVLNDLSIYNLPIKIYVDDDLVDPKYMGHIGWFKQQIIKINISNFIKTEYYLVLDDDIFIVKPTSMKDFFDDDGRIFYCYEAHSENVEWLNNMCSLFKTTIEYATHPIWISSACEIIGNDINFIKSQTDIMGVTPQLFKTDIVKSMIRHIGNEWQSGIIEKIASEYQLYWNYIIKSDQKKLYVPSYKLYIQDTERNIISPSTIFDMERRINSAFVNKNQHFMVIQSHLKCPIDIISSFINIVIPL
jgi:hypothetical protein